jgi:hypothetical protein
MVRTSIYKMQRAGYIKRTPSSTALHESDNGKQPKSFEHILIMYQINFYTLDEWLG